MTPTYVVSNNSIKISNNGKIITVNRGEPCFEAVRTALFDGDVFRAIEATTVKGLTKQFLSDIGPDFVLKDDKFYFKGEELPGELNGRIQAMAAAGDSPVGLLKFWENLKRNPSHRSVSQLFGFLSNENIPITANGKILAYKALRADLKDIHSGTIDNAPGQTIVMERNKISDDPDLACHFGLHVGALNYAQQFGPSDREIVIVEVDPEHVVCVPHDASQQKMRVCQYRVVGFWNDVPLNSTTDETEVDGSGDVKTICAIPVTLTYSDLQTFTLDELRKIAGHQFKIVGASKIPGGKTALIRRMLKVARKP